MARKSYRRPSEATMRDIAEGLRVDMDRIEAHGPRWIADPSSAGLEDPETAALLYGLGLSIPRGWQVESAEIIAPNWYGSREDPWLIQVTVTNGATDETIELTTYDTDLIKDERYGLATRLAFEGFEYGLVGSL